MACRAKYSENSRSVPCDETGVCGVTGYPVEGDDDGKFAMAVDQVTEIVASVWYEITSISPRKKYEVVDDKKKVVRYLPTLQMFNAYFKALSPNNLGIDVDELKMLVFAFHRVYVGVLCQS